MDCWRDVLGIIVETNFIWDSGYEYFEIPEYHYMISFEEIRDFLVDLFKVFSLCEKDINKKFYYFGQKIAKKLREYADKWDNRDIKFKYFILDTFSTFEDIQSTYTPNHHILLGEPYCPSSIEEYFVLTRAIMMCETELCIPLMNQIDLENSNKTIQLFYKRLWEDIGPECRRLNNKGAKSSNE
jgi:hypothetical protein